MKSAYELAMERMAGDGDDKPLTDDQKERIAEVDRKFKAKIAERRIFLEQALADALGAENHEEAEKVRLQLADETADLEAKAEAEKEKIRNS